MKYTWTKLPKKSMHAFVEKYYNNKKKIKIEKLRGFKKTTGLRKVSIVFFYFLFFISWEENKKK
jgi:hypothetical protein